MSDIVRRLRAETDRICSEAAAEIAGLIYDNEMLLNRVQEQIAENDRLRAEIERLRAVITRAKDALLDGQSTQWVHDLLVAELVRK